MTAQEHQFEKLMAEYGILFEPGRKHNADRIDYFLPDCNMLVELKTYETPRLHEQLETVSGRSVMVLVGPGSIEDFRLMLKLATSHEIYNGDPRRIQNASR